MNIKELQAKIAAARNGLDEYTFTVNEVEYTIWLPQLVEIEDLDEYLQIMDATKMSVLTSLERTQLMGKFFSLVKDQDGNPVFDGMPPIMEGFGIDETTAFTTQIMTHLAKLFGGRSVATPQKTAQPATKTRKNKLSEQESK